MSTQVHATTMPGITKQTMRAVEFDSYGKADVLHLAERSLPERKSDELLIEVRASSVNPIDYRLRSGEMKGLLPGGFPRIPGFDVAGVVVACPPDSMFAPGDPVMAFLDHLRGGALAEYATCSIDVAAKLPDDMPMEEAAALPLAGTTALQALRDHGELKSGERVLVNGASGGVGAFAVQIARSFGCHVDAVASGDNEDFCRSLGAQHFYDYEQTDFSDSEERWDVVFDAAGQSGYRDARSALNEGGRYVSTEPDIKGMLMTVFTWPLSKSCKVLLAKADANDLRELIRLYETEQLKVFIDRVYSLEDAAAAHQRVETGVDRGKVVVRVK